MTTLELKLNLPERLAREVQAAGLLTPEALTDLLKDAMRRRAAQALLAGAERASKAGSNPSAQAAGAVYMIVASYATANGIVWGSAFKGMGAVTLTATAGATDIFYFRSDGANLIRAGYALNGGA